MSNARTEWLRERQKGVGGSEVAAVLGLSKWKGPFDVWLEKTGPLPDQEETLPMKLGTFLEDFIVQEYRNDTGYHVATGLDAISLPDAPWARCNLDGVVVLPDGTRGVLECKTAGDSRRWGEPGSCDVPEEYYCQAQWNCFIGGLQWCDMPVLFFDHSRRVECFHIIADPHFQQWMMETVREFWSHVESNTPPNPATGSEAEKIWPRHDGGKFAEADAETCEKLEMLKALKAEIKALDGRCKELESDVKLAIEDAEGLKDGEKILATWKSSTTNRLDTKSLKEAHGDLCEAFTKSTTSRRLLIK